MKAGVFLSAEGLSDASEGFRVDFSSTPPVVTDGPYAEAHEIFNGYWILEVASREEAEHWARKCPLGPGASLEVRRINDLADFDVPGAPSGSRRSRSGARRSRELRTRRPAPPHPSGGAGCRRRCSRQTAFVSGGYSSAICRSTR